MAKFERNPSGSFPEKTKNKLPDFPLLIYRQIDSLWVKCRQKQANPLSLVECCCRIIKMSIFPGSMEKVTRLCLPSGIVRVLTKQAFVNDIVHQITVIHEVD